MSPGLKGSSLGCKGISALAPSAEIATRLIIEGAVNRLSSLPVVISQTMAVPSSDPETPLFPSALNATDGKLFWLGNCSMACPCERSQRRRVVSREAEMACLPSGLKATHQTV